VERLRFDVNGAWRISQVGVFSGSLFWLSAYCILYLNNNCCSLM
jgi:hypothetical protein